MNATFSRRPSLLILITSGIGLLFLLVPVLIIVPLSLGEAQFLEFPPTAWTLKWYKVFFTDPVWLSSLRTSFEIACLVSVFSVILSTMAAVAIVRSELPFVRLIVAVLLSPMIIPTIVTAIALYSFFSATGVVGGYWAVVIGHTIIAVPLVTINVAAGLVGFDPIYERASMSLGASPVRSFFSVTLPNILPSVASGALLAFVTSFDDVVLALFLGGRTMTLSRKIWEDLVVLVEPTQAAASTVLMAVSIVLLLVWALIQWLGQRRS